MIGEEMEALHSQDDQPIKVHIARCRHLEVPLSITISSKAACNGGAHRSRLHSQDNQPEGVQISGCHHLRVPLSVFGLLRAVLYNTKTGR